MKNNKKGFTLIEILSAIIIIGIILAVAIPSIISITKSIKNKEYESKVELIISTAEIYAQKNSDYFNNNSLIQITVETLLSHGYLNSDEECDESKYGCIIDPREKTSLNNESIVIKKRLSLYSAEFGEIKKFVMYFDGNGIDSSLLMATSVGCEDDDGDGYCTIIAPSISRDGYTAVGWSLRENETVSDFNPGEKILLDQYITEETLYAITYKTLTANFENSNSLVESYDSNHASCDIYNSETECEITTPTIVGAKIEVDGYKWGWEEKGEDNSISYNINKKYNATQISNNYYASLSSTSNSVFSGASTTIKGNTTYATKKVRMVYCYKYPKISLNSKTCECPENYRLIYTQNRMKLENITCYNHTLPVYKYSKVIYHYKSKTNSKEKIKCTLFDCETNFLYERNSIINFDNCNYFRCENSITGETITYFH